MANRHRRQYLELGWCGALLHAQELALARVVVEVKGPGVGEVAALRRRCGGVRLSQPGLAQLAAGLLRRTPQQHAHGGGVTEST